ncbi:MAG: hypothetical protein PHN42_00020 [Bacilli bacterium]|nr:hypothetical protein [Bacilli bacterium]
MKKTLLSLLIMIIIFIGIDNVSAASCYMCGNTGNATYTWADDNPNTNSCSVVSKTQEECSGTYSAYACYMCGGSNNATYTWTTSNPNANSCSKVNKTQEECSGSSSYKKVTCGAKTEVPAALPVLVKNFINALKILVPVILIIFGMLDFAKASMSGDDKGISESRNKFIKRTIAAVIVFLVVTFVQLGFSVLGDKGSEAIACVDCFINGNC